MLLNQITEEGRRLGSIADLNISDMGANAPVGTTLALLERKLKTMSSGPGTRTLRHETGVQAT